MRHPADNIISMLNLTALGNHALTATQGFEEFPDFFKQSVDRLSDNWSQYLNINMKGLWDDSESKGSAASIPTYFIRYEDLILDPERVITELTCFFLDVPTIEGTVAELKVKKACE
jgi:hypothetical protein